MKRLFLAIVLVCMVGGAVPLAAQRPVDDTIFGREPTYMYGTWLPDSLPSNYFIDGFNLTQSYGKDFIHYHFVGHYGSSIYHSGTEYMIALYGQTGNHIEGREMYPANPVKVIGVAACGFADHYPHNVQAERGYGLQEYGLGPVQDTSLSNRVTEYLQLYSLHSGEPVLEAEGPWRPEWPHRNMYIHRTVGDIVVPVYEVMFDRGDLEFNTNFMVAGTCFNNETILFDAFWPENPYPFSYHHPVDQFLHYPTVYHTIAARDTVPDTYPYGPTTYWWKADAAGDDWYSLTDNSMGLLFIFPILDTTYPPCPEVTGLRRFSYRDTSATLKWNSGVRQTSWMLCYGNADSSSSTYDTLVTTAPTATCPL